MTSGFTKTVTAKLPARKRCLALASKLITVQTVLTTTTLAMDANSLSYSLELVAGSGCILNTEQRAALQTSLIILKKNYKFNRVLFWGKILGLKEHYFIAQGRRDDELKDTQHFYR